MREKMVLESCRSLPKVELCAFSTVAMSGQSQDIGSSYFPLQRLRYAAFTGYVNAPTRLCPETWPWDPLQPPSSVCKPRVRLH